MSADDDMAFLEGLMPDEEELRARSCPQCKVHEKRIRELEAELEKLRLRSPGKPKAEDKAKLISFMLEEVEADLQDKGRPNAFIESLREQWDERGTLTEKQVEALRRFYERV